jgi:predicted GNAT family N-acyltransferase
VAEEPEPASPASGSAGAAVEVRWLGAPEELQGAFALRERVFHGEQGVPPQEEFDGLDEQARHVVALEPGAGAVVGTLRLLVDGRLAKIGRVAVDREWRRRGIATRMLELGIAGARERDCVKVRLAAQIAASEVYRQVGFAVESEEFEEAGIPHVWMGLEL